MGKRATVAIRVNPDVEAGGARVSTGKAKASSASAWPRLSGHANAANMAGAGPSVSAASPRSPIWAP
jgi:hypothetical protein